MGVMAADESTTPGNDFDDYSATLNEQIENSLTDQQKLVILIIAVSLFFITLLITICIVSPCCYISKLIKKWFPKASDQMANNSILKQYISPETKSFQLTVVPQYVEKQKLDLNLSKNDKLNLLNSQGEPINLYNNSLNETNLKRKLLKDIFQSREINCNTFFLNNKNLDADDSYKKWTNLEDVKLHDKINGLNRLNGQFDSTRNSSFISHSNTDPTEIIVSLRTEKVTNPTKPSNNLRLVLHLKQIKHLPLKTNGLEPSFYCTITGLGTSSAFRKTSNRKLNCFHHYQSEIFKPRTLSPMLNLKYYSDELTKSVLKDAKLLIRIMAVEKYANDHCLGELVINLKQMLNEEKLIEKSSFNEKEDLFKCYKLKIPKEIKGELLLTIRFLPTARRANFSIQSASMNNQLNIIDFNQNYFVRVVMCCNGKVIKKKKTETCSGAKLEWFDSPTLTFDLINLNEYQLEQICFLVVLVCTQQTITESISSPSSPDSPVDQTTAYHNFMKPPNAVEDLTRKGDKNLSKKDNIAIGHWMLTSDEWIKITHEPRNEFTRWVKLQ